MRILLAGVITALLMPASASAAPCKNANLVVAQANVTKVRKAVLCAVNQQRANAGLTKLRAQKQLAKAAALHTNDMVTRSYFAHDGPGGDTLVTRVHNAHYVTDSLRLWRVGENIAFGAGSAANAATIVTAWMNSPEHRAAILSTVYHDAGLGIAPGTPGGEAGATFTMDFGKRKK